MRYALYQRDIDMLFQTSKELYSKIQLLNQDFSVVDELQGITISGTIAIDAGADIRRTYSSTIYLKEDGLVGKDNRIWLDKYIRIDLGVRDLRTDDIVYYPLGIFLFHENSFVYDEISHSLTISCLDFMSKLNGIRNGQLSGMSTQIPEGSAIREAMIAAVSGLGGFQNYIIEDMDKAVPYDLKFSAGATVFDIVKALRDLYPAYEAFFDIDGVFVCKKIPTCADDNIVLDAETMGKLVKSEAISHAFSEIKNKTEVWGKSISADRFAEASTMTSNQYNITLDHFEIKSNIKIGFYAINDNPANPTLQINELPPYGIYDENEQPIPASRIKANKSYVLRFKNNKFYFMGQFQIYGVSEDTNPQSPYYVGDNKENVILQVLGGGDYDNIYSDELCRQRAEYENWKSTRLTDKLVLQMVFVPWLDVNQKVEYTSRLTGETNQYIVKTIHFDIAVGMMGVELIRFYPLYPEIVKDQQKGAIL